MLDLRCWFFFEVIGVADSGFLYADIRTGLLSLMFAERTQRVSIPLTGIAAGRHQL